MTTMKTNPLLRELSDWAPAVDILENDTDIVIKAELPGIEPKDVSVSLDNNVLTLKGERHSEREISRENYHRMERATGSFSRSFVIPASIDADRVTADFKNGLLTITLPKREGASGRTIRVNIA